MSATAEQSADPDAETLGEAPKSSDDTSSATTDADAGAMDPTSQELDLESKGQTEDFPPPSSSLGPPEATQSFEAGANSPLEPTRAPFSQRSTGTELSPDTITSTLAESQPSTATIEASKPLSSTLTEAPIEEPASLSSLPDDFTLSGRASDVRNAEPTQSDDSNALPSTSTVTASSTVAAPESFSPSSLAAVTSLPSTEPTTETAVLPSTAIERTEVSLSSSASTESGTASQPVASFVGVSTLLTSAERTFELVSVSTLVTSLSTPEVVASASLDLEISLALSLSDTIQAGSASSAVLSGSFPSADAIASASATPRSSPAVSQVEATSLSLGPSGILASPPVITQPASTFLASQQSTAKATLDQGSLDDLLSSQPNSDAGAIATASSNNANENLSSVSFTGLLAATVAQKLAGESVSLRLSAARTVTVFETLCADGRTIRSTAPLTAATQLFDGTGNTPSDSAGLPDPSSTSVSNTTAPRGAKPIVVAFGVLGGFVALFLLVYLAIWLLRKRNIKRRELGRFSFFGSGLHRRQSFLDGEETLSHRSSLHSDLSLHNSGRSSWPGINRSPSHLRHALTDDLMDDQPATWTDRPLAPVPAMQQLPSNAPSLVRPRLSLIAEEDSARSSLRSRSSLDSSGLFFGPQAAATR